MKKIILLVVFLVKSLNAQKNNDNTNPNEIDDDYVKKFSFELFSGAAIGTLNNFEPYVENSGYTSSFRLAMHFGFEVQYTLNEYLAFKSGINYIPKGGNFKTKSSSVIIIDNTGASNAINQNIIKLNYVDFPLILVVNSKNQKVNFEIGYSFGFLTGSSYRYNTYSGYGSKTSETWNEEPLDYEVESNLNSLILGINHMDKAEWLNNNKYIIGFRFSKGLSSIIKDGQIEGESISVNNNTYLIKLGVQL